MPILDVEIVTEPGESLKDDLARQLADLAGDILGSERGGTWVKVQTLPREQYAENGDLLADIRPVFVSVLMGQHPSQETMKQQAERLAAAFAQACGRPKENVHVLYQPNAGGRIAFGGKLVIS
jgi:phenylpyruvate tautomerase PptA (4-oxalocrotonate tautomerase family)